LLVLALKGKERQIGEPFNRCMAGRAGYLPIKNKEE
jgi:hypothetical protein